jgi:hypothetical protein
MRPALLRAAAAIPRRYERRRPEQTTLYRLVQQHYETFAAEVGLPQFVKDEFEAYLECGIPRLRGGGDLLRTASCACAATAARASCWSPLAANCAAIRKLRPLVRHAASFVKLRTGMAQTAAYLVECVIPRVPVRQWVLSFPMPLRSLFAVHPELLAPVLQIIHRVINTFLIKQTHVKRREAATGAITLIQIE